jgi:hypothetical protein
VQLAGVVDPDRADTVRAGQVDDAYTVSCSVATIVSPQTTIGEA